MKKRIVLKGVVQALQLMAMTLLPFSTGASGISIDVKLAAIHYDTTTVGKFSSIWDLSIPSPRETVQWSLWRQRDGKTVAVDYMGTFLLFGTEKVTRARIGFALDTDKLVCTVDNETKFTYLIDESYTRSIKGWVGESSFLAVEGISYPLFKGSTDDPGLTCVFRIGFHPEN